MIDSAFLSLLLNVFMLYKKNLVTFINLLKNKGFGIDKIYDLYKNSFIKYDYNILTGIVNGFATAAGFAISIIILAGIREKIEYNDVPHTFKGSPIVLITARLMSIAFFGFSGLI